MLYFRCGLVILATTYIFSLCSQIAKETNSLDAGFVLLYVASGAIAGKIIYDRYRQIHILGSLTPNPNVTSFANKISSVSASLLLLGFLVYLFLFLLKVDSYGLTALSIFICGFGTLYIWTQSLITTYLSSLYYDKGLTTLRQYLTNVSFLVLIVMAIFGTITSVLPKGGTRAVYGCLVVTSMCNYVLTAIFCVYILSFEKEYQYFSDGLRSEMLLDDACSLTSGSFSDICIFGTQESNPSTFFIKGNTGSSKAS